MSAWDGSSNLLPRDLSAVATDVSCCDIGHALVLMLSRRRLSRRSLRILSAAAEDPDAGYQLQNLADCYCCKILSLGN